MNIIIVPDSFKGTFTSMEVIKHIRNGFEKHFENAVYTEIPIADGGEGTVDAIVHALKGTYYKCKVHDPLNRIIEAKYGICGKTAVIEMAEASGLTKLGADERQPLLTSTFGVGELILNTLKHDIKDIIIGIGGSATNDGGTGMLKALGVRFYDDCGEILEEGGQILSRIKRIDCTSLNTRLFEIPITVMCDVTNPLTGQNGATMVYGPQKGADKDTLHILEEGMSNYKEKLFELNGIDVDLIKGTGAAGGLGAAFVSIIKAVLKPGIEAILDLVDFDSMLDAADLVITGEGKMDEQTIYGKVPSGISKRCMGKKAKVIAIVGTEGNNAKKAYDYGIDAIISTVNRPIDEGQLMDNAEQRLIEAVDTLCRLIKIGIELKTQYRREL